MNITIKMIGKSGNISYQQGEWLEKFKFKCGEKCYPLIQHTNDGKPFVHYIPVSSVIEIKVQQNKE